MVIAGYLGLITLLDRMFGGGRTAAESAIVVLVLAVIFNPVRVWLQRRVDRLFYGSRQDPARAVAEVGTRLRENAAGTTGLEGALAALCETLRVPAAAIRVDGTVLAQIGGLSDEPHLAPLMRGTTKVWELLIRPRVANVSCPRPTGASLPCSRISSRSPYRPLNWPMSWWSREQI